MRDAFGSTFMFKLIIIFIVFYVCFATIAVSYAKTFRLKNQVVNIVEQYQYNHETNKDKAIGKIDAYLGNNNYSNKDRVSSTCTNGNTAAVVTNNGACILPIPYGKNNDKYYYKVTVYMIVHIPAFNFDFIIPVSGDTNDYT